MFGIFGTGIFVPKTSQRRCSAPSRDDRRDSSSSRRCGNSTSANLRLIVVGKLLLQAAIEGRQRVDGRLAAAPFFLWSQDEEHIDVLQRLGLRMSPVRARQNVVRYVKALAHTLARIFVPLLRIFAFRRAEFQVLSKLLKCLSRGRREQGQTTVCRRNGYLGR